MSPIGEKGVRDPFIIRSPDGKKACLIGVNDTFGGAEKGDFGGEVRTSGTGRNEAATSAAIGT